MKKNKSKWYETYKITTELDKEEAKRRIESKTALKHEWSVENFLFYGKRIGDWEYRVYISSLKVSPRGRSNPFLPKVILEIMANSEGKSIVFFHMKPINLIWMYLLLFFTLILSDESVLVYASLLCLGTFLLMKYWEFAYRCVGQWLEELLEVKKKTEE